MIADTHTRIASQGREGFENAKKMAAVASQTVGLSIAAVSSTHFSNCIMIERESALYLLVCISVSPIIC